MCIRNLLYIIPYISSTGLLDLPATHQILLSTLFYTDMALRKTQVYSRRARQGYRLRPESTVNYRLSHHADMAELVDALASGASERKFVEVQVLLSAPT